MNDLCIEKVVNMYYKQHENWKREKFAPRGYDCVVLFTAGQVEYNFDHKTLIAREGDLLFLPGNLPYSGKKHTRQVGYYVVDFLCTRQEAFSRLIAPAVIRDRQELRADFSGALEQWQRQSSYVQLRLKGLIYSILSDAFDSRAFQPTAQTKEILDYICARLGDSSLTVASLCRHFYISESQLRRNIQKATGMNPNTYLLTLRINRAKNELLHTDKRVKAIAQGCGFSSPYYFSRCFTQATGLSPGQYRKQTAI